MTDRRASGYAHNERGEATMLLYDEHQVAGHISDLLKDLNSTNGFVENVATCLLAKVILDPILFPPNPEQDKTKTQEEQSRMR
jgi:hypothetical protein